MDYTYMVRQNKVQKFVNIINYYYICIEWGDDAQYNNNNDAKINK